MKNAKLLVAATVCLAGVVGSAQVTLAASDSTQVPKAAQSTTTDTDITTGSVAKSGEHPKMGVDAKCKEILANQTGHSADEVKACGKKSE